MTEVAARDMQAPRKPGLLQRAIFMGVTALCFVYLYYRLNGAAVREGLSLTEYMSEVFANVAWIPWLLLMVSYSCLYFLIDTLVTTSALGWFIKKIQTSYRYELALTSSPSSMNKSAKVRWPTISTGAIRSQVGRSARSCCSSCSARPFTC